MGQEIERKFLVRGDGWRQGASGVFCLQGYLLAEVGRTIRVRIHGTQAYLTIKGKREGMTRLEYEYPIPVVDAHEMLERFCVSPWVEKTRYVVWHAGMKWEIDEFLQENQGLIVAEVELKSEGQVVELPSWVGEEVSHDPRYLNVNLAKHPYSQWTDQQKT